MSISTFQHYKGWGVALSVGALVMVGSWTGATLKTDREQRLAAQASPAVRLEQMEMIREKLVLQRHELQAKISELEAKQATTAKT